MSKDSILCHDKDDAKNCIDAVGGENIEDWEFLEDGKVRIYLNKSVKEIANEVDKTR